MPRTRDFDCDTALDAALRLFWSKGYEAASLAELTAAMGLSKSSLYNTFGDKQALFRAAVDRYEQVHMAQALAVLADARRPVPLRVEAFLRRILVARFGDGDRRGCFIGNTAAEVAPHDPHMAARVAAAFRRIEDALAAALEEGRETGEVAPDADARALARFFTATAQGLRLLSKADADPRALDDVVRVALSVLR
ncbi:TetR/AcrR family transcriptional regulator [Caenispirillum bisanense]|uniref:Transcriptional regulator, TetR family n=1 Tax=Caenispirillum bisanense TaxID=414052 RepID=A0A286GAW7_9PROT|nr:TetR/AcrR family transcriptional regulator [Caenispirillum bisanense]SOD92406.1 transcriptional regulator, TetR family [Caenispirillum bisanense]